MASKFLFALYTATNIFLPSCSFVSLFMSFGLCHFRTNSTFLDNFIIIWYLLFLWSLFKFKVKLEFTLCRVYSISNHFLFHKVVQLSDNSYCTVHIFPTDLNNVFHILNSCMPLVLFVDYLVGFVAVSLYLCLMTHYSHYCSSINFTISVLNCPGFLIFLISSILILQLIFLTF